jgi:hypothetical protein
MAALECANVHASCGGCVCVCVCMCVRARVSCVCAVGARLVVCVLDCVCVFYVWCRWIACVNATSDAHSAHCAAVSCAPVAASTRDTATTHSLRGPPECNGTVSVLLNATAHTNAAVCIDGAGSTNAAGGAIARPLRCVCTAHAHQPILGSSRAVPITTATIACEYDCPWQRCISHWMASASELLITTACAAGGHNTRDWGSGCALHCEGQGWSHSNQRSNPSHKPPVRSGLTNGSTSCVLDNGRSPDGLTNGSTSCVLDNGRDGCATGRQCAS